MLGQHGRMDAPCELAQLGGRLGELGDRLVRHGRCRFGILGQLRLDRPERQRGSR